MTAEVTQGLLLIAQGEHWLLNYWVDTSGWCADEAQVQQGSMKIFSSDPGLPSDYQSGKIDSEYQCFLVL